MDYRLFENSQSKYQYLLYLLNICGSIFRTNLSAPLFSLHTVHFELFNFCYTMLFFVSSSIPLRRLLMLLFFWYMSFFVNDICR